MKRVLGKANLGFQGFGQSRRGW